MQNSKLNGDTGADILRSLQDYSDVASWINDALDEEGEDGQGEYDLNELDRRVSHLSAILEVACEDTSAQLEKTIEGVSRTVPRLTYDLQLMQESSLSLQNALQAVERHSESFLNTSEMGPVLDQLHYLDTVKRNMEASLAVLREAEAWSSLESEVVSYLSEQAYSKAAARLSEASKSLNVFHNTPEYETRKTLMINLQNQLEAALSSALVAGINNNDVDACKRYFDIFCHIEREAEFRSYWNGSKRKGIVALWQESRLRDCDDSTANQDGKRFAAFLPEFYQHFLSVLQVERLSAVLIFPDPQPSLSTFITSTLASLHPSPSQRLDALVNFYGDLALPEVISSFKATEEFAVATDKLMEKVGYSSLSPAVVPSSIEDRENHPSTSRAQRRRSSRQSFSRRLTRSSISGLPPTNLGAVTGPASLDHSWEEALFETFLDYQCDYGTLEKRLLRAQLRDLLVPASTASGGARLLRERAVDVLSFSDEALARCTAFTHGYGVAGLIQALDDLFSAFLQSARRDILDASSTHAPEASTLESGEEFAELDYSPSDLAAFQLALHLLEAARGVLERLTVYEAKLRANILQTSSSIRMARNDPFGLYVSGTTRTALSLIQSSALNSLELQSLLDAVDPEQPPPQTQVPHSAFTPSSATFAAQKTPAPPVVLGRTALLIGARNAVSEFAKACQVRLQETLLAPLFKHLSTYASLPVWVSVDPRDRRGGGTSSSTTGGGGGGAVSEVVIPTFSLSPSNTIQRVAEGLLSLPRLFEVYADDDALAFSIETLPFVDAGKLVALSAEAASASVSGTTTTNEGESSESASSRPKARHLPSSSLSITVPSSQAYPSSSISTSIPSLPSLPPTLILTPQILSSAWLTSLTLTLLSHLTSVVLPSLPRLSPRGVAQLSEDLGYLSQIGRALGVEWGALEVWREAVAVGVAPGTGTEGEGEGEVRRRIRELKEGGGVGKEDGETGGKGDGESEGEGGGGGEGSVSREDTLEIWKTVAKLRGISV